MALDCGFDVVPFTVATGGSFPQQQTITIPVPPGKTPKGVRVVISGASALDTVTTTARVSIGIYDGTNSFSIGYFAEHNVGAATADTGRRQGLGTVAQLIGTGSTALLSEATPISFGTNTFTLEWSADPVTAFRGYIEFWWGADVSCWAGQLTSGAAITNTVATTAPGFQPDYIFADAVDIAFASPSGASNDATLSSGYAVRSPTLLQACSSIVAEDRQSNTSVGQITRNDAIVSILTSTAGVIAELGQVGISAIGASGFTIITQSTTGNTVAMYFAVKYGGQPGWVGVPTMTTSAVATYSNTDPGFKPFALFINGCQLGVASLNTTNANAGPLSIGAASSRQSALASVFDIDNATTSNARSIASSANIVDILTGAATHDWTANLVSFDRLGFTLNITDASAADRIAAVMALGIAPIISPNTENISDGFAFRVSHKLRSSDTEQISDQAIFVVTSTRRALTDTENISDAFVFRTTDRRTSTDAEQISDAFVFRINDKRIAGDIEQISDGHVFAVSSSTATMVSLDTENISEQVALIVGRKLISLDTENISDGFVTKLQASAGSMVATDTERISDSFVLVSRVARALFADIERITDTSTLILGRVIVSGDTVRITDQGNTGAGAIALKRTLRGTVFDG